MYRLEHASQSHFNCNNINKSTFCGCEAHVVINTEIRRNMKKRRNCATRSHEGENSRIRSHIHELEATFFASCECVHFSVDRASHSCVRASQTERSQRPTAHICPDNPGGIHLARVGLESQTEKHGDVSWVSSNQRHRCIKRLCSSSPACPV